MVDIDLSTSQTKSLYHFSKNTLLAISIGIFVLAILARIIPGPRTIDDAFITYRYVRNILAGIGFVYNPGEQVLGTTTPLYTLLLTAFGYFVGGQNAPFSNIAFIINK